MLKKIIPLLLVIFIPLSALSHTEIAFLSPENGSILSEAPNEIYIVYHLVYSWWCQLSCQGL